VGREVRKVPANWQHPKYTADNAPFPTAVGRYIPMLDKSHAVALHEWRTEHLPKWMAGLQLWRKEKKVRRHSDETWTIEEAIADAARNGRAPRGRPPYTWWAGECPDQPKPEHYMPDWPEAERTHFMMYEDTSEGTPISPAFETPEKLAQWLVDNKASAFGGETATYEGWLRVARGGYACSAVSVGGNLVNAVDGLTDIENQK
jgi:hypothetical protein